jgi:lysophospholipase L1-like esterase
MRTLLAKFTDRVRIGRATIGRAILASAILAATAPFAHAQSSNDWPNLARYAKANADLGSMKPEPRRVVFMGNSITEAWATHFAQLFPAKPYVGRGISGQTTPQMLLRFRQDVIALKPAVVVILGGTNDIAGNTGPSTLEMIEDDLASMAELAAAHGIRVVLCSVLPVSDYPWKPSIEPGPRIVMLNTWIREYARAHGAEYADFHAVMADNRLGLPTELAADGVHPTMAGYAMMGPIVEKAIQLALHR